MNYKYTFISRLELLCSKSKVLLCRVENI